jgi:hypothetical protein
VCATGRLFDNPTPRLHVVKHDGACGIHVPSPHALCQAKSEPYAAAELVTSRLSSAGASHYTVRLFRCHGCNATWQESRATA